MLTSKSVAIAETLALDFKGDVAAQTSPVVGALVDTLSGAIPLSAADYAARLPELSATSPEYAAISETITTKMADNMRSVFEQIRVFGRGVSGAVVDAIHKSDFYMRDTNRMAKDFLLGQMELSFVRTDHAFFSSLYYPVSAPKLAVTFEQISLAELDKVRFAHWEPQQIQNWLNIDNPEINELMMSANVDVSRALTDLGQCYCLPFAIDSDNNTIDFTKPYLSSAETLFVQYILLSKMKSEEAPFEGLTKGGLAEFREHISLLHAAYQQALIQLKSNASALSSVPVRLVEQGEVAVRDAAVVEGSRTFKRVRARAVIYYSTAGMELCIAAGVNFSDIALAYFYRKYMNLDPSIAFGYFSDMDGAREYLNDLTRSVIEVAMSEAETVYQRAIAGALVAFIANSPELNNSGDGAVDNIVRSVAEFMGKHAFASNLTRYVSEGSVSMSDAVFASGLPCAFLEYVGCRDAACVLDMTMALGSAGDCEITKRENLHVACIQHFVNKLCTAE